MEVRRTLFHKSASHRAFCRMHRSIARPFFIKDRIKDFEIFDKYAMKAIGKMKQRFDEGYALNFEVGNVLDCSSKGLTGQPQTQDMIIRFTFDAACEFLFEATLKTLDSEFPYPHTQPHSGDQASARKMTREEAFFQAIIGAETIMSDRLYMGAPWLLAEFFKDKSEPYMEVINGFLNPVIEEGIAKHAVKTETGPTDCEGDTLLDSLLRETTGGVTSKLHREPCS